MSKQRSQRQRPQKFSCPHCERRLWRLGSPKHFLLHRGVSNIQPNLDISGKKAIFLAAKDVDNHTWIEDFFCGEDGPLRLLVHMKADRTLVTVPMSTERSHVRINCHLDSRSTGTTENRQLGQRL